MTGKHPRHYVLSAAGRKGPYSPAELRQLAADGFVPPETPTEPEGGGPPEPLAAVIARAGIPSARGEPAAAMRRAVDTASEVPGSPVVPWHLPLASPSPPDGKKRRKWLTAAGVLCLAAAAGLGYEWLRPLTARETARRALEARTVAEAEPYCTPRMTRFWGEVFKTPDGSDDAGDKVELVAERDAPGVPGARAVDFKGRLRDGGSGRVVWVTGFVLLLGGDRWRMDDLLVTSYDGREAGEPLSMVAARESIPAGTRGPVLFGPGPGPDFDPALGSASTLIPFRLAGRAFDWGYRRFGLAGGIVSGGFVLVLVGAAYHSSNQTKKRK